jgi:hypothetical protein
MERPDLEELVLIWERWTNGDPVLRQVWESTEGRGISDRKLQDQVLARLGLLTSGPARQATSTPAAVLAGWAVLLALEGVDEALGYDWRRMRHDALQAHRQALEERA